MPCECEDGEATEARLIEENNKLSQYLCSLCRILENTNAKTHSFIKSVPGLDKWWQKHQMLDKERMEEERREAKIMKLKAQALTKLSNEEREAFNH